MAYIPSQSLSRLVKTTPAYTGYTVLKDRYLNDCVSAQSVILSFLGSSFPLRVPSSIFSSSFVSSSASSLAVIPSSVSTASRSFYHTSTNTYAASVDTSSSSSTSTDIQRYIQTVSFRVAQKVQEYQHTNSSSTKYSKECALWAKELQQTDSLPVLQAVYQQYLYSTSSYLVSSTDPSSSPFEACIVYRSAKPFVTYIQQLSKLNQLRLMVQEVEKAWNCGNPSKNTTKSRPTTDVNSHIFITILNAFLTAPIIPNNKSPEFKDSLTSSQRSDTALWLLLWYINHCNSSNLNRLNTSLLLSSTDSSAIAQLTSAQKENTLGLINQSIVNTVLKVFNQYGPPRDSLIDRLGIRHVTISNEEKDKKWVTILWPNNKDLTKSITLAKEERSLPAVQRLLLAGRTYTPLSERAYLWQVRNGLWIRERGKLPEKTAPQAVTAKQLWTSGSDDTAVTVDTESLIKRTVSNFSSAVDNAKAQLQKERGSTDTSSSTTKKPKEENIMIDLRPLDYHPLVDLPEDSSSLLRLITGLLREVTGTYIYTNGIGTIPLSKLPYESSPNAGTLKEIFTFANSIGDIRHCLVIAQYYKIELTGPALTAGVERAMQLGSIDTAQLILSNAEKQLQQRIQHRSVHQQKKQEKRKKDNLAVTKSVSESTTKLPSQFEACKISIEDAYGTFMHELVKTKQYSLAVEVYATMQKKGYRLTAIGLGSLFRAYKVLGLSEEITQAWKQGLLTLPSWSTFSSQTVSLLSVSSTSLPAGTIIYNTQQNLQTISQYLVKFIETQTKKPTTITLPPLLPISKDSTWVPFSSSSYPTVSLSTDAYIYGIRSMAVPVLMDRMKERGTTAETIPTNGASLSYLCYGLVHEFIAHLPLTASSSSSSTLSLRRHVMAAYIQTFCEIGELDLALQVINSCLVFGLHFHEKDLLPIIYNITKQEEIPLAFSVLQIMIRANIYPTAETSQALMSMVTVVARQNIPLSDEVVKALNIQISNDRNIMKLMSTSSSTVGSVVTDITVDSTEPAEKSVDPTLVTDNTLIIPELITKDKFRLQKDTYDPNRIDIQRLSILADTELAHSASLILGGGNRTSSNPLPTKPTHPLAEAVLTARILTTAIIRWLTQQMELIIQQQQDTLKFIQASSGSATDVGETDGVPNNNRTNDEDEDETSPLVIAQEMIRLILSEWPVSSQLANVRDQLDSLQVPRLSLQAKLATNPAVPINIDGTTVGKDTNNDEWLSSSSTASVKATQTKFNRPAAAVRTIPAVLEKSLDVMDDSLGQYLSRYTWESTHQSNKATNGSEKDTTEGIETKTTISSSSSSSLASIVTSSSTSMEELTTALREAAVRARERVNRRITMYPSVTSSVAVSKWDQLINKLDNSIKIMKQHQLALPPKLTKSLAKTVAEIALSGAPLPRPVLTKKTTGTTKSNASAFLIEKKVNKGLEQLHGTNGTKTSTHHR